MAHAERPVRVASRGSQLARTQTQWVVDRLQACHPSLQAQVTVYRTRGDKIQGVALSRIGGKGLFTKELEDALLDGHADLAVHSLKDMPTALPPGLVLAAILPREDARDALITRDGRGLDDLPGGAVVGTSSLRRVAQLRGRRSDLTFASVRGNVDTRLRKLAEGQCDALVMAVAGLKRSGYTDRISQMLPVEWCLPAVGQGALAVEIRADDGRMRQLLAPLHDAAAAACVAAERAFLASVEGGCQVPAAAHARLEGEVLILEGLVASLDGQTVVRRSLRGAAAAGVALGEELAVAVLAGGGAEILADVRRRAEQGEA